MMGKMTDREKAINDIVDTIRGEINRMCTTSSIAELDTMTLHATENIKKLQELIYEDLVDRINMEDPRQRYNPFPCPYIGRDKTCEDCNCINIATQTRN